MKRLKVEKKISWWFSKPIIILEIIILILLFKGVAGVYSKYKRAEGKKENTQIEFDRVEGRYIKLGDKVEYLDSSFAQEEAFRERFDVVLPGEEVIKLVDKEIEVKEIKKIEKKGFWSRIFGF